MMHLEVHAGGAQFLVGDSLCIGSNQIDYEASTALIRLSGWSYDDALLLYCQHRIRLREHNRDMAYLRWRSVSSRVWEID